MEILEVWSVTPCAQPARPRQFEIEENRPGGDVHAPYGLGYLAATAPAADYFAGRGMSLTVQEGQGVGRGRWGWVLGAA